MKTQILNPRSRGTTGGKMLKLNCTFDIKNLLFFILVWLTQILMQFI